MTRALWLLAAALPLAAQPKLLVNAKTDTRSAASGLEREFKAMVSAQPQPSWIGYSVPAIRSNSLGCDYVRDSNSLTSGVVHLESPDSAIVMFRVDNNQVGQIRTISPYCEIDAGAVPVHWLNDVQPAQSVALLSTFATEREGFSSSALHAIGMHADGSADQALEKFLAANQPESVRRRAISYVGRRPRGLDLLKKAIAGDPDSRVREQAVSSLANSRQPEAVELLISIAKSDNDSRLRNQAVSGLGRKSGAKIVATLAAIAESDRDPSVRKRALSALQSMPDGEGVPVLIQMARTQRDLETRKQAMSTLQHSRDPRALAFFEEVIKK
jgi:HEAT repeat protein